MSNSFDSAFLEESITNSNYTLLKNNKERIKLLYNIDQDGHAYSCAFRIRTSSINNLSNNEIETILTRAMQHRFRLTNIPDGVRFFYYAFAVTYLIN